MENIDKQGKFELESKLSYMYNLTSRIAEEFIIHNKYFNISDYYYSQIVNSANDKINLSNREKELIIKNSKFLLRYKYGIEVISDSPIAIKKNS